MSEDAFEPSFPSYDGYMDDVPYGSPLEDDDIPLNLELSSVPHSQRANSTRNWNGVLKMNYEDDEPLIDLNDIEDDDDQLLDLENTLESYSRANVVARFYARFPWLIALIALAIAAVAGVVSYLCYDLTGILTFDDPTAGFEARRTDLSAKSKSASALLYSGFDREDSELHDVFSYEANEALILNKLGLNSSAIHLRKKRSPQRDIEIPKTADGYMAYNVCAYYNAMPFPNSDDIDNTLQYVFESKSGKSLYTAEAMHSICRMEDKFLRDYRVFYRNYKMPCRQLSLPFYITAMVGKDSCYDITNEDMQMFKELLLQCWKPFSANATDIYIHDLSTNPCIKYRIMYNVFFYLVDTGFINKDGLQLGKLTYTLLMGNRAQLQTDTTMVETYFTDYLEKNDKSEGDVKLAGFFFSENLKFDLFDDYLMGDLWLFGLAMGIILLIMLVYLLSVTLMFATLVNVAMSFVTAYCLYNLVFKIEFFPFINLLAGLILIAIGADDVFIFYDTWDQNKKEDRTIPLDVLVAKTFNHAALSIFVTSLTTSAAFFANSVSNIIAIKCFGIFAGLAVLANFFFMITWTPAVIIMIDKYRRLNLSSGILFGSSFILMPPIVVARLLDFCLESVCNVCTLKKTLGKLTNYMFGEVFPWLIEKLWALWLLIFLGIGVGGLVAVFYSPKLKLPHSKEIQLFPDSQVIERWSQELRTNFRYIIDADNKQLESISIEFVWGIEPKDNGDMYDTNAKMTLVPDSSFDLVSLESQKWMIEFCHDLVKQSFVDPRYRENTAGHPCLFTLYEEMLASACLQKRSAVSGHMKPTDELYLSPCCKRGVLSFPANASDLNICLPIVADVALNDRMGSPDVLGQILFNRKNNLPTGYMIQVFTTKSFSTSYDEMKSNVELFENYFKKKLETAPSGLKNGYVTSIHYYNFFDLQQSIANGTYYSIILSLSVAFVVMLMTSLNVLITIYALLTISLAIAATIASLVFMGWELNIIESVTISLAVGLSIDFTIHYGVAYGLSDEKMQKARVRESFARVGSAVVMAALTTFLAGAAMMPSHIMGYRELGIFLMLVMAFSWVYATFFFQSLCRMVGPRGSFCQITLPCFKRKRARGDTELERQGNVGALMLRSDSEDSLLVTF